MAESKLPQRWLPPVVEPVPPTATVEQESTLKSVLQLIGLVRRHWLLVGLIAAASVGILVYRLRNEPHIYRATATIRLEDKARELSNGMSPAPRLQSYRPFTDPVLSQLQVLQSQAVAESVAVREGLRLRALPRWLTPNWATAISVSPGARSDTMHVSFSDSGVTARSRIGTTHAPYNVPVMLGGVQFTVTQYPGIRSADLTLTSTENAANDVRGGLTGAARERTDVIDVSYTAPDPDLAARVANAAVHVFQDYSAQTAKQQSILRRQFISQQLDKSEALLADARSAYNAFRSREKVFSSQDKFRAQQADLSAIELRRQELVADRGTYTTLLDELQRAEGSGTTAPRLIALAASPGVATNSVMSQLFGQLVNLQSTRDSLTTGRWGSSANNPDVQKLDTLIVGAEAKVIDAARANVSVIDARLSALDQQKATVSAGLAGLPQADATEATLMAQVTTYSRQVDRLRDELQSAEIAEAAEVGQVEIVDLATADGVPIGTGRKPKALLALVLGLILGTIAAYVIENYRPVIRRRDELEQTIDLPNLALVPQIRGANGNGAGLLGAGRFLPMMGRHSNGNGRIAVENPTTELVTVSDARSSGAEAYRTLRTNLLFSAAVTALQRVVITSPGPAEGKSTTAANLAIAFAQQGHRVLLVDCDLRRSRVHKLFGESQSPGLTNVLVGGIAPSDAIRPTKVDGLLILPSGALPPNPAELLGSPQMKELLDKLGESYDLLILDSPPLLAASDAAILSRIVDGALVVVRAGRTERTALLAAVQQLTTVGARVLGTVLNDPDAEVPKYTRYYSYYYNNYYEYKTNGEYSTSSKA
ncbi:MAG TPA: polysaccharide biosynthesis tyrosine autokinase [Acidobacteriaceae bacterium]|nr:polysaccharide biosynthesis tyrosine autokinase [Acidobacteriaceae bacterium]